MTTESWRQLLLFVFVTHLPIFAWRWRTTGERRFAATSITFALLVVAYGIAVFAPELHIGGTPLFQVVRVFAWSSAVVSIALLVRHHALRLRRSRA